jgi:hypothetical protein
MVVTRLWFQRHALKFIPLLLLAAIGVQFFYPADNVIRKHCRSCFRGVNMEHYEEKITLMRVLANEEALPRASSIPASRTPLVAGSIGRWGYRMDRQAKIIDIIAISDPLLARLPCNHRTIPSMGILKRDVPQGYLLAAITGNTERMHPDIGVYYQKLRHIVSGDLWSVARVLEIIYFNSGRYDHLRNNYLEFKARQPISRRQKPSGQSITSTAL